jgi:hypothetical protein
MGGASNGIEGNFREFIEKKLPRILLNRASRLVWVRRGSSVTSRRKSLGTAQTCPRVHLELQE